MRRALAGGSCYLSKEAAVGVGGAPVFFQGLRDYGTTGSGDGVPRAGESSQGPAPGGRSPKPVGRGRGRG